MWWPAQLLHFPTPCCFFCDVAGPRTLFSRARSTHPSIWAGQRRAMRLQLKDLFAGAGCSGFGFQKCSTLTGFISTSPNARALLLPSEIRRSKDFLSMEARAACTPAYAQHWSGLPGAQRAWETNKKSQLRSGPACGHQEMRFATRCC